MTTQEFSTMEKVRASAEAEYEREHPQPDPPTPAAISRPTVVRVGGHAHLWVDVNMDSTYSRNSNVTAKMFIIDREGERDQRIEGYITAETLDGLIQELNRIQAELSAAQTFIGANESFGERLKDWEREKSAFARRQVAAWEKTAKKKE